MKIVFLNGFLRNIIDCYFFEKKYFLFITYKKKKRCLKKCIIKDIRNNFILKKELSYTAIKDIINIFRIENFFRPEQLKILMNTNGLVILKIFLSMKRKTVTNQ